jgi:hypothetical protein
MTAQAKQPDWSKRLFWLLLTVFVVVLIMVPMIVYLASQTLMGQEGG